MLMQVVLHMHCAKEPAVISKLVSTLDPKSGEARKQRPRAIPKNCAAVIEVSPDCVGGGPFCIVVLIFLALF